MRVQIVLGGILAVAAVAGGALWWLQTYGYYSAVDPADIEELQLTSLVTAEPEPFGAENVKQITGPDNPLRFRACFDAAPSLAMASETYVAYDAAEPLIGPGWFSCFDAKTLGAQLERGDALAFLGQANITYGVDRVIALTADGRGYAWHQLNACGEAAFSGDPLPETCPPAPKEAQ